VLGPFGTHVHILEEKRVKLNDKNKKFMFIGYDPNSKGYKLYHLNNKNIVVSRDAVFDKEAQSNFGLHNKKYNLFLEFEKETSIEVHYMPYSPTLSTYEDI